MAGHLSRRLDHEATEQPEFHRRGTVFELGLASGAIERRKSTTFEILDFGVVPRPTVTQVLLRSPAVHQELKITEAQKKEQAEIEKKRTRSSSRRHGKRRPRQVLG